MEIQNCALIWMTNRARLWLYEKLARETAFERNLIPAEIASLDTSFLEDTHIGMTMLIKEITKIKENKRSDTIIIIKDAKWEPSGTSLRNSYPDMQILCADVPIAMVEHYPSTGDVEGLSTYITGLF